MMKSGNLENQEEYGWRVGMNPIQTDILFENQEGDRYKKQGIKKEMNGKDQENEKIKRIKKKTNEVRG